MVELYSFAFGTGIKRVASFDRTCQRWIERQLIKNFSDVFSTKLEYLTMLFGDGESGDVMAFGKRFRIEEDEDIIKKIRKYFKQNPGELLAGMRSEWEKCRDVTMLTETDVFYIISLDDRFPLRVIEIISGKPINKKTCFYITEE